MSGEKFILTDAPSRNILYTVDNKDIAHFLYHNILDSRLACTEIEHWDTFLSTLGLVDSDLLGKKVFTWQNSSIILSNANELFFEKRKKVRILIKGYKFLLTFLDRQTTDLFSSGYYLTLEDIMLFPNISDLADHLVEVTGLSYEKAIKHLHIEKESILNIHKHKKLCLWRHSAELIKLDDMTQYDSWKDNVKKISGGIGLI